MTGYLAYVDHPLALQIATGLIGSEVGLSKSTQSTAGVNFKVIFSATEMAQHSTTTRLEHLLPEVLVDALVDAVPNTFDLLDDVRDRLHAGHSEHLMPGSSLHLRRAQLFAVPDDAEGVEKVLAGEECEVALLRSGDFEIRAFMNLAHAGAVSRLYSKPLEVLGVLRYTPSYGDGGASAVNLGLRVAALWLK